MEQARGEGVCVLVLLSWALSSLPGAEVTLFALWMLSIQSLYSYSRCFLSLLSVPFPSFVFFVIWFFLFWGVFLGLSIVHNSLPGFSVSLSFILLLFLSKVPRYYTVVAVIATVHSRAFATEEVAIEYSI